ncbi:hypothetical protein D3C76_1457930 [compost metagenome]
MLKHFEHRAAGFDDLIGWQAFAQQVISGDGAVGEIYISGMVNDAAVDFFRNTHVEAAIARLHVKGRDLPALGGQHSHAAVGVAKDQQGLRLDLSQHFVHRDDHITDGFSPTRACSVQEMIRFADTQVLEEDFIKLVVIILAGVNQNMLAVFIQARNHAR